MVAACGFIDFDAMGQRLTASGTTDLNNVTVLPEVLRKHSAPKDKRSAITPFLQLYLGAVMAGIARNALTDAVAFAQKHAGRSSIARRTVVSSKNSRWPTKPMLHNPKSPNFSCAIA